MEGLSLAYKLTGEIKTLNGPSIVIMSRRWNLWLNPEDSHLILYPLRFEDVRKDRAPVAYYSVPLSTANSHIIFPHRDSQPNHFVHFNTCSPHLATTRVPRLHVAFGPSIITHSNVWCGGAHSHVACYVTPWHKHATSTHATNGGGEMRSRTGVNSVDFSVKTFWLQPQRFIYKLIYLL